MELACQLTTMSLYTRNSLQKKHRHDLVLAQLYTVLFGLSKRCSNTQKLEIGLVLYRSNHSYFRYSLDKELHLMHVRLLWLPKMCPPPKITLVLLRKHLYFVPLRWVVIAAGLRGEITVPQL